MRGTGPDSDIVVSSRIRLARNVAHFRFLSRASDAERAEIEAFVRSKVQNLRGPGDISYFDVSKLSTLDRQLLVERQLISRELAEAEGARGVGIGPHEQFSVMINEEDHLRIQVLRSGFALEDCWKEINDVDDRLENVLTYAHDPQFGYLTACPTNAGTGIRVSVMLHLPALVASKEIQRVLRGLQKINLAVRGLYGEGSQAMGDFYQVSNQVTLGPTEKQLIESVTDVIPNIIRYEKEVRAKLLKEGRQMLHDQVARAYGLLCSARSISSEETMHLLSTVRMGVCLDLIDDVEIPTINELFIYTQPAHLQKLRHETLDSAERNVARAAYLRHRLNDGAN